ncbi:hypothetical protein K491DRAFT_437162 [Lophiostoma macrostomum CBS 122681]|uniref:RING-type domain-containing protein n=1 Tax=Lophiostoma macrostomum CBS 122681 TaxID=1314788 RepID=A0A6A6T5K8_9PLEO|nr:hypothetical protein K491DRAFT_437162 [Lophiostoma macrostomum CBS 122681]
MASTQLHYTRRHFLQSHLHPATDVAKGDQCPICIENYNETNHKALKISNFPGCCRHTFGESCILQWFDSQTTAVKTCPMCRMELFLDQPCRSEGSLRGRSLISGQEYDIVPAGRAQVDGANVEIWQVTFLEPYQVSLRDSERQDFQDWVVLM